jgi:hypothetical protein
VLKEKAMEFNNYASLAVEKDEGRFQARGTGFQTLESGFKALETGLKSISTCITRRKH